MSDDRLPFDETYLRERLNGNPTEWDTRMRLADGLYDKEKYAEAAEIIWSAKYVPSNDLDLALCIRILAQAQPRKAIRLVAAILQFNQGQAAHNLAMASALLHHGMILQAARFYSAALAIDPSLVSPDFEYMMVSTDETHTVQSLVGKKLPNFRQAPRLIRDPKEEISFASRVSLYDAPVCLTDLSVVAGEEFNQGLNVQRPVKSVAAPAPISQSSVPTSVLHVKWSTAPAAPGAASIPVTAPPVAPVAPAEPTGPGPRKLNIPGK